MSTAKKLFTNPRIIFLIAVIILSLITINPGLNSDGVAIRSVDRNSSASKAGILSPNPNAAPMNREVITAINGQAITDVASYNTVVSSLTEGQDLSVRTTEKSYFLTLQPNSTDVGLSVYDRPRSNIRKGLDLEGGTRVLLQPEREVTPDELDLIIGNIRQRLNVFGVSDVIVRPAKDFSGNTFISVEIAGVNKDEVRTLLASQGKFEARVGNVTVFFGGDDIAYVCRTADCSGIDPQGGCGTIGAGEFVCRFRFAITLSGDAAQRQADATRNLTVVSNGIDEGYLSQNLTLFLDNELVNELSISAGLKGKAITEISISGSGTGPNEQEAAKAALADMKQLQTVLITGSLPVKLEIVKTDAISPVLGQSFLKNVLFIGIFALIAVIAVVIIRYREWRISIPMLITMVSEVIILLGLASIIGWRLDLAAIAGIIIAVGTGVDDQIVITDETLRKEQNTASSWKDRLKRAFFIIMAAYFTTVVAMLPLWFAGAGLLKGFALTTILGVSIGVFVTRPAFGAMVELLIEKR